MRCSTIVVAALGTAALAVVGCASSSGTSAGSSGGGQAPASTPAAVTWHAGGTYTGPVPPADPMPRPLHTWQLNPYNSPDGYKVKDAITFGVPLHYAIPRMMQDCYGGYQGGSEDLPPGQFVVPFEISIKNLTSQESPALAPQVWAGDTNGSATIDMTGGNVNGNDTDMLWANGDCTWPTRHNLGVSGSDALFGFVGPATPAQLQNTYVYVTWSKVNDPQAPPQLSLPLTSLLPHQGASWLVANTGKPIPGATPAPAASPTTCPPAPANYDQSQQAMFNSVCGIWLGQVASLLQDFDQADKGDPAKVEPAYCNWYIPLTADGQQPRGLAHLMPACLVGIKAAGAP